MLLGCDSEVAPGRDAGASPAADASRCSVLLGGGPSDGGGSVSFARDVLPIFGLSCNFDSCHRGSATGAHLGLGPKCSADPVTGRCVFDDGAVTPQVLDEVLANLLAPSDRGGRLARVEPGIPERSFLLLKLSDCQIEVAGDSACAGCGVAMPPGLTLSENSPERFAVIHRWVAAGAPRD